MKALAEQSGRGHEPHPPAELAPPGPPSSAPPAPPAPDLAPDHRRLTWPADRFYWGVLDSRNLPRNTDRGYLLEPVLPVPIESVHAVYEHMRDGRVLACAAPREALEELDAQALSLSPASLPAAVGDVEVDPTKLNLLIGAYEPKPVRRLRSIWQASAVLAIAACSALAALGLSRRAAVYERSAAETSAALTSLYDQVLPGRAPNSSQDPGLLLSAELERLRRTRTGAAPGHDSGDAAIVLADLLARWPGQVMLRTESLTVTPREITLTGLVDTADAVEPVRAALSQLDGWRLALPRTESTSEGEVRLTLRLTKEPN